MSDTPQVPRAVVRRNRRWSTAWIVPTVALVIALWLVWQHYVGQGALIHVRFQTADGIQAEKTDVRCRSVRVGHVETVNLSRDLKQVIITLRIDRKSEPLLRAGSRFWVVRPRVTPSDISGLGTLITGAYIELDPGEGNEGVKEFTGLEAPPVTNSSVPGLRLNLVAETAGAIGVGSPIFYKGFEVGRVERRTFDVQQRRVRYEVFITKEFVPLVTSGVRFWNTSGIDIEAGADGMKIRTPSLQAVLSGGASFAVPPDLPPGNPVSNGATFTLYTDEAASRQSNFNPSQRFLLFFDQSVRGLKKGAPVEFRGLPLGRVTDIAVKYAPQGDPRIPVIIDIDPSLMPSGSPVSSDGSKGAFLADAVKHGLRARLGTASFLTGALFIDLDFVHGVPDAEITQVDHLQVLPTAPAGLVQLEAKVTAILDKIQALPIEDLVAKYGKTATEINETLEEAKAALADAHQLLSKDQTQQLTTEINETLRQIRGSVTSLGPNGSVQGDVRRTLDELRAALRAFKTLSDTVAEKPNSLIFGKESTGNPVPHAHRD